MSPISIFLVSLLSSVSIAQPGTGNNLNSTPSSRHAIDQKQALAILQECSTYSTSSHAYENIAIVDPAGLLVAFLRTDNAYPGSIDISIKKARAVALFNGEYTSGDLYNLTQPGGVVYGIHETNGGLATWPGGFPIILEDFFIGAIGISGGSVEEDTVTANRGLDALGAKTF